MRSCFVFVASVGRLIEDVVSAMTTGGCEIEFKTNYGAVMSAAPTGACVLG